MAEGFSRRLKWRHLWVMWRPEKWEGSGCRHPPTRSKHPPTRTSAADRNIHPHAGNCVLVDVWSASCTLFNSAPSGHTFRWVAEFGVTTGLTARRCDTFGSAALGGYGRWLFKTQRYNYKCTRLAFLYRSISFIKFRFFHQTNNRTLHQYEAFVVLIHTDGGKR